MSDLPYLTPENNDLPSLINPIGYRNIILEATRSTYSEESRHRYIHFDSRLRRSRNPIESIRPYATNSNLYVINLEISKQGQRYFVEGNIIVQETGESSNIVAFLKTIPRRQTISRVTIGRNFLPPFSNLTDRINRIRNELEELRQDHNIVVANHPIPLQLESIPEQSQIDVPPRIPVQCYRRGYCTQDCCLQTSNGENEGDNTSTNH